MLWFWVMSEIFMEKVGFELSFEVWLEGSRSDVFRGE